MKLLKGRVDWLPGNVDRPYLYLLVDDVPEVEDMRFIQRQHFYYGERDGFCRFFSARAVDFRDDTAAILVKMQDGTMRAIQPGHEPVAYINENDLGPCMEVRYTRSERVWREGRTFNIGLVLVSWLRENADKIDVGQGYTWRPGSRYAAGVVFPRGSRFALACCGLSVSYGRDSRRERLWVVPEVLPDGALIENVRAAIHAAVAADHHDVGREISDRYVRYLGADPFDTLLALSSYEPAVKLPDGSFWVRPATD